MNEQEGRQGHQERAMGEAEGENEEKKKSETVQGAYWDAYGRRVNPETLAKGEEAVLRIPVLICETTKGAEKRSSETKVIALPPALRISLSLTSSSSILFILVFLISMGILKFDARKEQQLEQAYIAMTGDEKEKKRGGREGFSGFRKVGERKKFGEDEIREKVREEGGGGEKKACKERLVVVVGRRGLCSMGFPEGQAAKAAKGEERKGGGGKEDKEDDEERDEDEVAMKW
eukprot:749125-Hanusia_phi.AAC.2